MIKKLILILLAIGFISLLASCTYFKVNRSQNELIESINNVGELYKRFILHAEGRTFEIENIKINSDIISGNLISNPGNVRYTEFRKYRISSFEKDIKYEVHIYLNNPVELQNGILSLPIIDINRISIIEPDTGKDIAAFLGGTVGVLGVIVVIALATKSSCPYVYVHDGEGFVFEGETYGGATAANLARHDYMPLPSIRAVDGTYRLRLNNELKEHQFTDLAELLVIDHAKDQKVLLDKYGKAQLIEKPTNAVEATDQNGRDIQSILAEDDSISFLFNELQSSKHSATLTFEKPKNATHANLILKAQNSMWFDYLYGEVIGKLGNQYDSWAASQADMTREEHLQEVLDVGFPIFIYIKKKDNWEQVDYLLTPGPLASREFVIPMDISQITGDHLEVKVETGFMFWEMNYAKIDYTAPIKIKPLHLTATAALGSYAKDWTSALTRQDFNYMVQKNIGEITEMTFEVPEVAENQVQTVFLHTYGYYKLIREFEGIPDLFELQKFESPGYFSEYSQTEYLNMIRITEELANANHKNESYVNAK